MSLALAIMNYFAFVDTNMIDTVPEGSIASIGATAILCIISFALGELGSNKNVGASLVFGTTSGLLAGMFIGSVIFPYEGVISQFDRGTMSNNCLAFMATSGYIGQSIGLFIGDVIEANENRSLANVLDDIKA